MLRIWRERGESEALGMLRYVEILNVSHQIKSNINANCTNFLVKFYTLDQ